MLTILVKTSTNNNTLAKSIADTNTNTAFEKYSQYQYFYDNTFHCLLHSAMFIFSSHLLMKLMQWLLSRNDKITTGV